MTGPYRPGAGPTRPSGGARIRLPAMRRATLPNGLTVIVARSGAVPTVAINLTFRSGSGTDPLGRPGLAAVTGDMVLLGSRTTTAERIAETIDSLGASLVASTGWDSHSISACALSADLAPILEIIAELASDPSFPDEELEKLRKRLLNDLETKLDDPSTVAGEKFAELLFPEHPYGQPPDGTIESIRAVRRDDLLACHEQHYSPDNAILVIVGDVDPDGTVETVERVFRPWNGRPVAVPPIPEPSPPRGIRVALVDRPELTQSQVRIGHLGVARSTPDWFPLVIANYILGGGGFSSRLLEKIRVQKGYTYGLRSTFQARFSTGPFVISTFTPHATLPELVEETLGVVRRFREEGPEARELADAVNFQVSGYPRGFETPGQIASAITEVEIYSLGDDYLETCQDRFAAVTAGEVARVARNAFDPDNLLIVAVTRADEVGGRLGSISTTGEVEVLPPAGGRAAARGSSTASEGPTGWRSAPIGRRR